MPVTKQALKDELIALLGEALAGLEQAHQATLEAATH